MKLPHAGAGRASSRCKGLFYFGMLATIMSTVLSYTFLGAVTLGRDVVWRLRGDLDESRLTFYTRIGIVCHRSRSPWACLLMPSVVQLWYTLGSVCVPGLMAPVLSTYFGRRSITGTACAVCMAAGSVYRSRGSVGNGAHGGRVDGVSVRDRADASGADGILAVYAAARKTPPPRPLAS